MQWAPLDRAALPKADEHPRDGAVVLLDAQRAEFLEQGGEPIVRLTVQRQITLLRDSGRDWLEMHIPYDRSFSNVVSARARTITPDGQETIRGLSSFEDRMRSSASVLFEDERELMANFGSVPLGTYVEYEYVIEARQPELFQRSWRFGMPLPVRHAIFEVILPAEWEAAHHASALGESFDWPPKEEALAGGGRRWIWEKRDLPPFKAEPEGPEYNDVLPRVVVRLARWTIDGQQKKAPPDFETFSSWLHDLQQGTAEPTPEISAKVGELLAGAPNDPYEKARRLYDWVRSQIRYVAVEVGIGGWKPHSAAEVFETRYGDCKDKATLLKAMLRAAGIESRLGTLYAHGGFPRRIDGPVLGNTNHAILVIDLPGRTIFADPTARTVPFGELPFGDQGAEILPVAAAGAKILVTPAAEPELNTKRLKVELDVDGAGVDAAGRFDLQNQGSYAAYLHKDLLQFRGKKLNREIAAWLDFSSAKVTRREDAIGEPPKVAIRGELTVLDVLGGSGGLRMFRLSDVTRSMAPKLARRERITPVLLGQRKQRVLDLTLRLPVGLEAAAPPAPVAIESKYGNYQLTWQVEGRTITAQATFTSREIIVPAAEYSALLDFYDKVMEAESTAILIRSVQ